MGELQLVRVGDHEVVRVLRLEGFMKGFGGKGVRQSFCEEESSS